MKRPKSICFALILGFLFFSCGRSKEVKLPVVEVNGIEIPDLDPFLIEPVDIKLSQIGESFRTVILESNPECLLGGSAKLQIGDNYIIARDDLGIFQFSIDGSFIRKLVTIGRGPGEISAANCSCLIEDEDLFLVVTNNDIYMYCLSSGEFMGKKVKPEISANESLYDCVYIGDSRILYSFYNNGLVDPSASGCGVKIQTLDGSILWQHYFDYNSINIFSSTYKYVAGSRISLLSTNYSDEVIIRIIDQDTVYKLNTSSYSLRPALLNRIEKVKVDGFPVSIFAKGCSYENLEYKSINGYRLINFTSVNELSDDFSVILGDRYYIIYDDNQKSATRVGVFNNDYFGFLHETVGDRKLPHYFPTLLPPNGKLVVTFDAFTFLQFVDEALANPQLDANVRDRLLDISGKVTEISNPILLIGDIKEKIDL
ncbi:MAG: 6-bladed beta-propeller [Bacteroidales bacterium]|jgi:hypothetical protein